MLRDKEGNRLFRKVEVRITFPEKIFPVKTLSSHAGPGKGFGPDGIDEILMRVTDQLDTLYPWWDFKMTPLAPVGRTARYSFSFEGYRTGGAVPAFPDAMVNPDGVMWDPTQAEKVEVPFPEAQVLPEAVLSEGENGPQTV